MLYTIEFGAVATGSIKAQLALMVAGIMRIIGLISTPMAAAASMGIRSVVVAVFINLHKY